LKPEIITSSLATLPLRGKRVLVRADLNVPLLGTTIASAYKLQRLQPTLTLIAQRGGTIILATHIGRPTKYDAQLSTQLLLPWFAQHNYPVHFATTLRDACNYTPLDNRECILLENTRFFTGEKPAQLTFAQELAQLGDYFVQDAFGTLHDHDASIALTPLLFAPNQRTIGLLVEQELNALRPYRDGPNHALLLIVGGKKVASKVAYIHAMLDKIQTLVLLPPLVFTFLQACNRPVGRSYVDPSALATCKAILQGAAARNITVYIPHDYMVTHGTLEAPLNQDPVTQLADNQIGIACGPQSIAQITQLCNGAHSGIVVNGLMGFIDRPDTLTSMRTLLHAVAACPAYSIIGGGDTVALIEQSAMLNAFDYISTGGGALLAYLSSTSLPGLVPFLEHP